MPTGSVDLASSSDIAVVHLGFAAFGAVSRHTIGRSAEIVGGYLVPALDGAGTSNKHTGVRTKA